MKFEIYYMPNKLIYLNEIVIIILCFRTFKKPSKSKKNT